MRDRLVSHIEIQIRRGYGQSMHRGSYLKIIELSHRLVTTTCSKKYSKLADFARFQVDQKFKTSSESAPTGKCVRLYTPSFCITFMREKIKCLDLYQPS